VNYTPYTFTVKATNTTGISLASAASAKVVRATVPLRRADARPNNQYRHRSGLPRRDTDSSDCNLGVNFQVTGLNPSDPTINVPRALGRHRRPECLERDDGWLLP